MTLYGVEEQPRFIPPPGRGQADGVGDAAGFLVAPSIGHANGIGAASAFTPFYAVGQADGLGQAIGFGPVDAATSAWLTSVVANGGSVSSARLLTIDALITGLKSDGLWAKLDRLYILANENSVSARTDLVGGSLATFGSPTPAFTIDRGFTGAGAGGYINTNFNQSTASSPKAIQNDTHFSLWSNTTPLPTAATGEYCGADPGGGGTYWLYFTTDLKFYFRVNDNAAATALASSYSSHRGHFIASRNASTTRRVYYNGTLHDTTTSVSSAAVPNAAHTILSSGFTHQVCAYSIGSNLDAGSDASNFYNRLRTYMTTVGVP